MLQTSENEPPGINEYGVCHETGPLPPPPSGNSISNHLHNYVL